MPPTHWLRGRMDPSHTCGVLQRHRTIHKHGSRRTRRAFLVLKRRLSSMRGAFDESMSLETPADPPSVAAFSSPRVHRKTTQRVCEQCAGAGQGAGGGDGECVRGQGQRDLPGNALLLLSCCCCSSSCTSCTSSCSSSCCCACCSSSACSTSCGCCSSSSSCLAVCSQ